MGVKLKLDFEKLALLQASKCINLNELSEKSGIARTSLSCVINGKRNATPKTIGLIAKALNVEVEKLTYIEIL